jgi:hypothetical protein
MRMSTQSSRSLASPHCLDTHATTDLQRREATSRCNRIRAYRNSHAILSIKIVHFGAIVSHSRLQAQLLPKHQANETDALDQARLHDSITLPALRHHCPLLLPSSVVAVGYCFPVWRNCPHEVRHPTYPATTLLLFLEHSSPSWTDQGS